MKPILIIIILPGPGFILSLVVVFWIWVAHSEINMNWRIPNILKIIWFGPWGPKSRNLKYIWDPAQIVYRIVLTPNSMSGIVEVRGDSLAWTGFREILSLLDSWPDCVYLRKSIARVFLVVFSCCCLYSLLFNLKSGASASIVSMRGS